MGVRTTGLDAYVRELQQGADAAGAYRLQVSNPTEYAAALQDLDGYDAIDEAHLAETADGHVRPLFRSGLPVTRERLRNALDAAGFAEINYLRSLTGETQPGIGGEETVQFTTAGGTEVEFVAHRGVSAPERQAHPGHWADREGRLAGAFEHKVTG